MWHLSGGSRARWAGLIALLVGSLLLALPRALSAQDDTRAHGEGRVLLVDRAGGRIGLDHGPIPGLMPAMRMMFPVERSELLRDLHPGDRVRFTLRLHDLEWRIADISRAEE
jgi:Cu/Ag efflux protein CusF